MDRRGALVLIAGAIAAACGRTKRGDMTSSSTRAAQGTGKMPVIFIAHGAPPLLDDAAWQAELAAWSKAMPRPKSILMLSAHWEARPIAIGATSAVPLVYDFYGFPERYYATKYPSPGAPELAARVRELLRSNDVAHADEPARGLDHGSYVPLISMYPQADVPVLQVSLPGLDPKELFRFGRALAPLRDEGVLVAGSGFLTHNMRALGERTTPSWATEFDAWAAEIIAKKDVDALVDFHARAPAARLAHPREEHFAPMIAAAAAAMGEPGEVTFPITGFWGLAPAFTRRSVQIG
ncbi:MAG: dioxygenase [Labilithrix sp.]|nr:dioxygenase [Labilithrix sp.]